MHCRYKCARLTQMFRKRPCKGPRAGQQAGSELTDIARSGPGNSLILRSARNHFVRRGDEAHSCGPTTAPNKLDARIPPRCIAIGARAVFMWYPFRGNLSYLPRGTVRVGKSSGRSAVDTDGRLNLPPHRSRFSCTLFVTPYSPIISSTFDVCPASNAGSCWQMYRGSALNDPDTLRRSGHWRLACIVRNGVFQMVHRGSLLYWKHPHLNLR